jgi:uncharacterized membrane protein YgdD (TMEM256/DUF423 family)
MRIRDPLAALAAVSGALAVGAGAFGAHGAHGLPAELLKTGAQYQIVHAIAALVASARPMGRAAGWCFVGGGALFAGSLYALALGAPKVVGIVTPFGGLALIVGWVVLAIGALR